MFKSKDLFVYLIILFLFIYLYNSDKKNTDRFKITANGKHYTYSLKDNREIIIDGAIIRVENGKVCVKETDCKNKYCKEQGSISKNGEYIICVPKKIVISIGEEIDALSW